MVAIEFGMWRSGRITLRTTFRDTRNSRQIAFIGFLNEKRATDLCDRLHYQHPQPGFHVPMEATVDPPPRGSRLDVDQPQNGVLIACRFTILYRSAEISGHECAFDRR
jgi:hypothetical protein